MSSSKQVAANRANAQRSTGPRTADGKARARLNATKHGLGVSALAVPVLAPEVAELARALAENDEYDAHVMEAATRVAAATIDVARVRQVRAQILDRISRESELPTILSPDRDPTPRWPKSTRFSKAEFNRAAREDRLKELVAENVRDIQRKLVFTRLVEGEKQEHEAATRRAKEKHRQRAADWQQLETLERYERRALSRRVTAMAALDETLAVLRGE